MADLAAELETFCKAKGINRFTPSEMIELLQDGETASWIAQQVTPHCPAETNAELCRILEQIGLELPSRKDPGSALASGPEELVETISTQTVVEEEERLVEPIEPSITEFDASDLHGLSLPPGVDDKQVRELLDSPRGKLLADFGAFCEEKGVEPNEHAMDDAMIELHEEWLKTSRASLEGAKPADLLKGGRLFPQKIDTYRREGPKMGRNDPCSCGSGYKFKKCCGRVG